MLFVLLLLHILNQVLVVGEVRLVWFGAAAFLFFESGFLLSATVNFSRRFVAFLVSESFAFFLTGWLDKLIGVQGSGYEGLVLLHLWLAKVTTNFRCYFGLMTFDDTHNVFALLTR